MSRELTVYPEHPTSSSNLIKSFKSQSNSSGLNPISNLILQEWFRQLRKKSILKILQAHMKISVWSRQSVLLFLLLLFLFGLWSSKFSYRVNFLIKPNVQFSIKSWKLCVQFHQIIAFEITVKSYQFHKFNDFPNRTYNKYIKYLSSPGQESLNGIGSTVKIN